MVFGSSRALARTTGGWSVVAAAFVVMGIGYGVIFAFGAFFDALSTAFAADRGALAFAFSLASVLSLTGGIIAGPVADRLGPRPLCVVAGLLYLVGFGVASRATQLGQVYLTSGLLVGLAVGLTYVPALTAVQRWFVQRRGLASGIATAGIGAGTLVVPLVAGWLVATLGWRSAYLGIGVASWLVCSVAGWFLVDHPAGGGAAVGSTGPNLRAAMRTRAFPLIYLALLGTCFAAFAGYGHIVPYALDTGLDPGMATFGLSAIGAGSLLGRLVLSPLADRLGRQRSYAVTSLAVGASMGLWWLLPVPPVGNLIVVGLLLGTAFGAFVALSPSVAADHFGGRSLATIIGALYTGAGLGSLFGAWFTGVIFDSTHSYRLAIAACAGLALAASVAALLARTTQRRLDQRAHAGRRVLQRTSIVSDSGQQFGALDD